MLREIVLDTETTGLDPEQGHRLVEVAGVELVNHLPTGRTFHSYINPERDMPEEAFRVHGLSAAFLPTTRSSPRWSSPLLEFLGDSRLVIHNAAFDLRFLSAELTAHGRERLLARARRRHAVAGAAPLPGRLQQPGRAVPPLRRRQLGPQAARCPARLRAPGRGLPAPHRRPADGARPRPARAGHAAARIARPVRPPRPHAPSAEELAAHAAFMATLDDPVWLR